MLSIRPRSPSILRPSSSSDELGWSQASPSVLVAKRGWLYKQGGARGGRKSWKRRWFVLKEDCLYYYHSEDPVDPVLLGVMPLHLSTLLDLDSSSLAPPKRVDSAVCFECKRPFAITLRRHHCRRCGRSFCDRCSARSIPLPRLGYPTPVRVCDGCWEEQREDSDATESGGKAASGEEEQKEERERSESLGGEGRERRVGAFTLPAVSKPNLFALKNSERELWLQAESTEARIEWVHCIRTIQAKSEREVKAKDEPQWEVDFTQISLLNRVGGGTFGDVYRARLWGTEIAVKILKGEDFESGESVLEELKKEVSILSQLRHPNVVLYIGACTVPPHICIATEWCGRGSLHDVLDDHSLHIPCKLIVQLAMGIAQGVNYLHSLEHRIIHRDLKSANILVTRNWQVRVSDFGLSHMKQTLTSKGGADTPHHSNGGGKVDDDQYGIVGTPEYLAPEVMEGLAYTEKIDVYSFGILLCELVTRQPPFHDRFTITCYMDMVEAVLDEGAIPTIPRWCDTFLTPLILRCLSREPSERPSFTEIIMKLREVEGLEESEYFCLFDLPRLREQLESKDAQMQALGASELAVIVKERGVRRVRRVEVGGKRRAGRGFTESGAGYELKEVSATLPATTREGGVPGVFAATAPAASATLPPPPAPFSPSSSFASPSSAPDLWVLDDEFTQAVLERLTALLSSSFDNVQYACCLCLSAILAASASSSTPSSLFHAQDRDLIVSEGAIRLLLSLLTSPNPLVSAQAGEVLMVLCGDMTGGEMLQFVGAEREEMSVFVQVVEREVQRLEKQREEVERVLEGKRRLMGEVTALDQTKADRSDDGSQGREDRGVSHSHSKPRMQRKKSRGHRGGADSALTSPSLTPYPSSGDDRPTPPTLPQPNPVSAVDPLTPLKASTTALSSSLLSSSSTSSPTLSPRRSHLKKFEFVLQHIDGSVKNITLTHNAKGGRGGGGGGTRLGRSQSASNSSPHSLTSPAAVGGGVEGGGEEGVRGALRVRLVSLAGTRPSAAFAEYFPTIDLASYALRFDCEEGWTLCFLVLTQGEVRVYASHTDAPDEALAVIRLTGNVAVKTDDVEGMQLCLTVEDLGAHTFSFDCEHTRTQWKDSMATANPPRTPNGTTPTPLTTPTPVPHDADTALCESLLSEVPAVDDKVVESFRLEFPALRHAGYLLRRVGEEWQLAFFVLSDLTHLYSFDSHRSQPTDPDYQWEISPEHLSAACHLAHPAGPPRPAPFMLQTVGSQPALQLCAASATERELWTRALLPPSILPSSSPASPSSLTLLHPFLAFFTHVDHHGWLQRRKKYSSRWVRQFAVLVDAELYLYERAEDAPKDWALVCYVCTQSGKPFEVVRGGGKGGEWSWEMINPAGSVSLRAEGEKELDGWMRAMQDNCTRLSRVAHTRQRKATH